jgi:hypothetical protein
MNVLALKGKAYDAVKYTVLVGIPALSTAYIGMDAALDGALPHEDQVVKALAVVALLLGSLTGISKLNYNNSDERFDGTAFVDRTNQTNNPTVMLKDPKGDPPKALVLRVQETEIASGGAPRQGGDAPVA